MSFRVTYTCAFLLLFCGPFFAHERVLTKNRDESMVSTGFQGSSDEKFLAYFNCKTQPTLNTLVICYVSLPHKKMLLV